MQILKGGAVYLSDSRWKQADANNSIDVKVDVFHGQEFIILEDAKVLPEQKVDNVQTEAKMKNSVLKHGRQSECRAFT